MTKILHTSHQPMPYKPGRKESRDDLRNQRMNSRASTSSRTRKPPMTLPTIRALPDLDDEPEGEK